MTDQSRDLAEIARQHGVSEVAARQLLDALERGGGRQAQFNHPDLGGMGQWQSGMLSIGDMFNNQLKGRVSGLIDALVPLVGHEKDAPTKAAPAEGDEGGNGGERARKSWWPDGLGSPASTGSQNDMRYAVFPDDRRLAVEVDGKVTLYDTGDHHVSGVSQQQSGTQSIRISSQHGMLAPEQLKVVTD